MTDSPFKRRLRYSIAYKQQVLNEYQYRFSCNQVQCAAAHDIDQGMLSRWIQQTEKIFGSPKSSKSVGSGQKTKFPELDLVALEWVKVQRKKGLAVKSLKIQRYVKKYILK